MQVAVRITGEQLCDLADRLNRAEFTVHRAERDEYGIRAQQLAHLLGVDRAVAADAQQVDLPAALLKCSQAAADRGMLERSGDDVPADVARGLCDTLDGEIVRLGRARGENDLGGGAPVSDAICSAAQAICSRAARPAAWTELGLAVKRRSMSQKRRAPQGRPGAWAA